MIQKQDGLEKMKKFYKQQKEIMENFYDLSNKNSEDDSLYEDYLAVKGIVGGIDGCLRIFGINPNDIL